MRQRNEDHWRREGMILRVIIIAALTLGAVTLTLVAASAVRVDNRTATGDTAIPRVIP